MYQICTMCQCKESFPDLIDFHLRMVLVAVVPPSTKPTTSLLKLEGGRDRVWFRLKSQ